MRGGPIGLALGGLSAEPRLLRSMRSGDDIRPAKRRTAEGRGSSLGGGRFIISAEVPRGLADPPSSRSRRDEPYWNMASSVGGVRLDIVASVSVNGVAHPDTGHAFQMVQAVDILRVINLSQSSCIVCTVPLSLHKAETIAGVCVCLNCGLYAHRKCACSSAAPLCATTTTGCPTPTPSPSPSPSDERGDGLTHLLRAKFTDLFLRVKHGILLGRGSKPTVPSASPPSPQATIWEEAVLDVVSHCKEGNWTPLPKDGRVESFCQNLLSDENTVPGRSVVRLVALFLSISDAEAPAVQLKSARKCLDSLICVLLSSLPSGVLDELHDDVIGAICELCDVHCLTHSQGAMLQRCLELSKLVVAVGEREFDQDKVVAALLDARENPLPAFDFWFSNVHLLNVQSSLSASGKLQSLVLVQRTLADDDTPSDTLLAKIKHLLILSSSGPTQTPAAFTAALRGWSAECVFMRALKSEATSSIGIEAFALETLEAAISLFLVE